MNQDEKIREKIFLPTVINSIIILLNTIDIQTFYCCVNILY